MDRIHYAGASVVTGTEIAQAVLEYAKALARAGSADTVNIPIIDEWGAQRRSELLIGPASELITRTEQSPFDEVVDPEFVGELREKADALRRYGTSTTTAVVEDDAPGSTWSDYDEI